MFLFACLFCFVCFVFVVFFLVLGPNRGYHNFENCFRILGFASQGQEKIMCFINHVCFSCNRLFYENKLLDGVTAEDRTPLVVSEMFYLSH